MGNKQSLYHSQLQFEISEVQTFESVEEILEKHGTTVWRKLKPSHKTFDPQAFPPTEHLGYNYRV